VKVLAFDCSASRGSVAVVEDGSVLFAEAFDCPRGRGGEFFLALERAVKAAGRADRVVVGVGPGSYNGLRASISAAEGLALATGAELTGVASVRAMPCAESEYVVVNDVRGGAFSYARIRGREMSGEIELLDRTAFQERVAREAAPVFANAPIAFLPRLEIAFPEAAILAELGAAESAGSGGVEPLYLKPAHITKPKQPGLHPAGQ